MLTRVLSIYPRVGNISYIHEASRKNTWSQWNAFTESKELRQERAVRRRSFFFSKFPAERAFSKPPFDTAFQMDDVQKARLWQGFYKISTWIYQFSLSRFFSSFPSNKIHGWLIIKW